MKIKRLTSWSLSIAMLIGITSFSGCDLKELINNSTEQEEEIPDSQVGNRRYARGRAYDPNRYGKIEVSDVDTIAEAEAEVNVTEAAAEE